jgi:lipopolysaccharide transport system ATP-binding protein
MSAVARGGRTVLFVSHNMASMTALCSRAILVDAGRVVLDGPTDATIRGYLTSVNKASNTRLADRTDRRGTGPLKFLEAWVEDEQGNRVDVVQSGNRVSIVAVYASDGSRAIRSPYIAFSVRDSAGRPLTDLQNHASSPDGGVFPASGRVKCTIPRLPLNEGDYYFSAYCSVDRTLSDHVVNAGKFRVSAGDFFGTGKVPDTRFPVFFQQTWHVEGR